MSVSPLLPHWFARGIAALQAGDTDGYVALYAPDAIHEIPFAPDGVPSRLVGRDAIAAYARTIPGRLRFGPLVDVRAREVGGELIIEAVGHHLRARDGAPIEMSYVWFIAHEDELVTRWRDYMNPLQLAELT